MKLPSKTICQLSALSRALTDPKADDFDRIIISQYKGFEIQKIKHELFGDKEVEVYAIRTGNKL